MKWSPLMAWSPPHSRITESAILPQWWGVDLGSDSTVTSVVIYNRGGCGGVCQRE